MKHVPGRKTDVVDCQWLQEWHRVGLLRGSVRPTAASAALRADLRHRETLVQRAAAHVQRMQQALVQMNRQLSIVISDMTGGTGLRMLRAIIAGRTDPHALAPHRDARCQASAAETTAALTGHDRPEHVFVLQQHRERFDAYQRQLAAWDAAIETHVHPLAAQAPAPAGPSAHRSANAARPWPRPLRLTRLTAPSAASRLPSPFPRLDPPPLTRRRCSAPAEAAAPGLDASPGNMLYFDYALAPGKSHASNEEVLP